MEFQGCYCTTPGCQGILQADGKHQGIFRKKKDLAFTHEVMYQWAAKIGPGSPDTWSTAWRDHLLRLMGHSEKQSEWWSRHKKAFSEATMDFIRLQHIDYAAGFRCDCSEGQLLFCKMYACLRSIRVSGFSYHNTAQSCCFQFRVKQGKHCMHCTNLLI